MFFLFVPWEKSHKQLGCMTFLATAWTPTATGYGVDQYLSFYPLRPNINEKINLLFINTKVMPNYLSILKLKDLHF